MRKMGPPARGLKSRIQPPAPAMERIKQSRLVVNQEVLGRRNPAAVAAVGAWVESAWGQWGTEGESRALLSVHEIEEQLIQNQKEKQERLKRFQGEVKRRVNHHAKLRKNQLLQKSYDAIAKEGVVVKQSSDAAMHLTPKRNTCLYRNTEVAICSPRSQFVSVQKIYENEEGLNEDNNSNKLFKQHSRTLSKTMKQVRYRLAALKTVEKEEEMEFPGGIWRVSPTRDNPVSRRSPTIPRQEDDTEELFLAGYHDLPLELQMQKLDGLSEKEDASCSLKTDRAACNRLMKESYPTGPAPAFSTDYRAALVLRPGVDEEENRKQRQNQYLMYRRLFMDIEREQVKETKRQKEHEKKISKIKKEKEFQRQMEEERLREEKLNVREKELAISRYIQDQTEANEKENREQTQKSKEYIRYVEALRAQMKEKMLLHNIELPPLCCCGSDFWDSHPDTCANNCFFYKNPKAYTRALQSVLSSRDMWDGNISSRFSACNITTGLTRSFK
ncbi:coiled-coil domain-containing protein 15 [Bombina bombina]|uniref:coiled-coil domain-containing protein 15 n=1 Tax=Bombina bombina TaxID=8345 RepID=UPI00235AD59D|nr:coiled-coil domain-containing protein 15 [Bombina bombina]